MAKKIDESKIENKRLWKLMCERGIEDVSALAKEIYDYIDFRCPADKPDKSSDTTSYDYKRYEKNKELAQKKITKNLYDISSLDSNYLLAYCKFFKCSADYLLGLIDLPTHKDTDINKETGLSKDAIDILEEDKNLHFPYALTAINFLLAKDDYIDDKRKLFRLILQYILLSQNIKSYYECDVSKMENKEIDLCDEYGKSIGPVPLDKMSNVFLLSINEILSKLKDNIAKNQSRQKPTLFDILDDMIFDLIRIQDVYENIDGFNFDIDNLSVMNRRFEENKKRLIYLYNCRSINDIDFKSFLKEYPQYNNHHIELLKETLNF